MCNNEIAMWLVNDIEAYETLSFTNGDSKYWVHLYRGTDTILVSVIQRDDEPFVVSNSKFDIDDTSAIYVDLSTGGIEAVEDLYSIEMRYLIQENKIPPAVRKMTIDEFRKILKNGHVTDKVTCIKQHDNVVYILDKTPKSYDEIMSMISKDPELCKKDTQFVVREYDSGFNKYFDSIITIV